MPAFIITRIQTGDFLEFDSVDHAQESARRLNASGVLDRFEDSHGPNLVMEAAPGGS